MRKSALSVDEALARILAGVAPLASEAVALIEAAGRTLAKPVVASLTQPPFDASAMDGYAVRAGDVTALPASLTLVGEAAAGHAFSGGPLAAGQTVRIFTGAPLPDGADAIVIQENVTRDGDAVMVIDGKPDPAHIRPSGGDFAAGTVGIEAGTLLMPRHIALAAAMGHTELTARRKPIVAILATGDELVPPGTIPGPGQIVSSNSYAIAAMVARAGAQPRLLGIASDTLASLSAHLEAAADADILITIGGASVGDHDLVTKALGNAGFTLDFWKIAMRPGKPLMFAQKSAGVRGPRAVGVPGNPVSSIVCTSIFVVPLIAALLGRTATDGAAELEARLTGPLEANGPRTHYMRAHLAIAADGTATVAPAPSQDSSLLTVLAGANALIIRPPHAAALESGDKVTVRPIDF